MLITYYLISFIIVLFSYNSGYKYSNNDISGTWLIVDNNTSTADYTIRFDNNGIVKYFSTLHDKTSGNISINKNGNIAGTISNNNYALLLNGKFRDINCIDCSITIPGEPKIEGVMHRVNKLTDNNKVRTAILVNNQNNTNKQLEIDNSGTVKDINHDIIGKLYIANNYFRCEIVLNNNQINLKGSFKDNKIKGFSESGTNIITCNTIEISQ